MATQAVTSPLIIERRWTQTEFRRLPEGPPYYELEEGELIEMPRPRRIHQAIIKKLLVALDQYLTRQPIGDVWSCLLYTSPSPRDRTRSRMPSSA